jgi:hypothetical protein
LLLPTSGPFSRDTLKVVEFGLWRVLDYSKTKREGMHAFRQ